MRLYENISSSMNDKINDKLNRIESDMFRKNTIPAERQYDFLIFLQSLSLTSKQVHDIYTNTKLQ